MCQRNGNLSDTDVGFYSGLIESLFSLTQMLVMILWGKAADRFGRKPVLVFSLVGVSVATSIFGLATTIWEMVLFRCLAGVFAGTIVTVRTMISEHSTQKTQAVAFSWFAFTGNLGILFGPLIGGAFAQPAEQYPGLFGDIAFFVKYPYALPSIVTGSIGMAITVCCALFLEETLPSKSGKAPHNDPEATFVVGEASLDVAVAATKPAASGTWELIKAPGVAIVLYTYSHIMLLAFAFTAIVPLWWFTPVALGGFEFTPLQISIFLAYNGLAQALWILLVFPPLQHRIGTLAVLRLCAIAYPVFFLLAPLQNMLLRSGDPVLTKLFWISAPLVLGAGSGVSMSFTAIQLALNDASPSPQVLGTLNALSLALVSGIRSFSPALFASLFAVGAKTQWLDGYAIWLLMAAMAAGFTVVSRYLPDYEEMRRRRERGDDAANGSSETAEED